MRGSPFGVWRSTGLVLMEVAFLDPQDLTIVSLLIRCQSYHCAAPHPPLPYLLCHRACGLLSLCLVVLRTSPLPRRSTLSEAGTHSETGEVESVAGAFLRLRGSEIIESLVCTATANLVIVDDLQG